jgi:hypothetical protein
MALDIFTTAKRHLFLNFQRAASASLDNILAGSDTAFLRRLGFCPLVDVLGLSLRQNSLLRYPHLHYL